jgi:hypothetical protein
VGGRPDPTGGRAWRRACRCAVARS